jgi:hypothetical protein
MTCLRQIRASDARARSAEIGEAARSILAYSSGYTEDWLFRKLDSGIMMLLEVVQGGSGAGFVVAQVDTHSDLRVLYLWGVYGRPGSRLDYPGLRATLELLAREKRCSHIRAKSPRRGWGRIAAAMGFEPVAIEYERQVAA